MTNFEAHIEAVLPFRPLCQSNSWFGLLFAMLLSCGLAKPLLALERSHDRLDAILQIQSIVPHSARTAEGLGTRRSGTGVVIDDDGLILTVGYIILEAIDVSILTPDGQTHPADIVAYDHITGFGLIRVSKDLDVEPLSLGNAGDVGLMEPLLVASRIGELEANGVYMVDRRPFAGYWEYLLEDAIFTAPPYAQFGGAALINRQGQLVGIGSLVLNNANPHSGPGAANMFIPVDDLKPILDDLLANGRRTEPANPWLGLFLEEYRGRIFVTHVAPGGPAQAAGMVVGDLILGIDGTIAQSLADFYRALWQRGEPGIDIPLDVIRDDQMSQKVIKSGDRYQYLRLDPTF